MDRLISLEPSSEVAIRIEPGQKCSGEVTLRNVMYTMPVAYRLQPVNRARYVVRPQSGIIAPLAALTVEIAYLLPVHSPVPDSVPFSDDSFLLHSVVVPGAAVKDPISALDSVPNDWFTTKKKQVFIDTGIKVFFVGSAVLTRLVAAGSMDSVREVLERSDPTWRAADSVNSTGESLLHIAIGQSRPDLVQLLLEFGADVAARSRGRTPLEATAAAGEALAAELLLARGAAPERALQLAAAAGYVEVVKLLLSKGATPDAAALRIAAEAGRREAARLLLSAGAAAEVKSGADGGTALHAAARRGDELMAKLLVAKSAAGLTAVRDAAGRTPLEVASEAGHVGRMLDLLGLGDKLMAAARKGEVRAIERAMEKGVGLDGRDGHGWTALMRAAFKGRAEMVRWLIEKGAEVEARDDQGYTALHCAVEAGHVEAVEALIKRGGADPAARTVKGVTPMRIAVMLGYTGIARILAHAGAEEEEEEAVAVKSAIRKTGSGGGGVGEEKERERRRRRRRGRGSGRSGSGKGFVIREEVAVPSSH
ncbi:protein VAPYRIN-like [Typha latifolia]|uniref:protein VAPYRIN-like n=1 Tax=Typha latifolia TaxID=4733 RepID=UPI003C2FD7A7